MPQQDHLTARLVVDDDFEVAPVNNRLFGSFVEHLGRCVYTGIYEPDHPTADEHGFRKDVIDLVKELGATTIRYPGGNFVSGYRWEDGIGPKQERPRRLDLAWHSTETNEFGLHEFIDWCKKAGAAPMYAVNLGTRGADAARNIVEYANHPGGTYWSDLRKKNGAQEPLNIKLWCLGNEMDGQWQMGHKNAEDYGKFALETAKLMKWIDRDIKLVVAGSSDYNGNWIDWNRTVLEYLKNHADYIALHNYVENRSNDYYKFMATTRFAEKAIRITEGLIAEAMTKAERKDPIYIAFDEYNVWYRAKGEEGNEEVYNLEDALVVSTFLNIFVRNAHVVKMANMAQLVNVIAPIFSTKEGSWYQTIFYPLQLFATHCHGTSLDTFVDCDTEELIERTPTICRVNVLFGDERGRRVTWDAVEARPELFGASSIPMNVEVTSVEATKGTALVWLCERLGVDVADTVAFGDSGNDVAMLDVAGDAVAMENASPEVKAHARHVAPRCELAGVARYLEPLLV